MTTLFITATNTNIGKTFASTLLIERLKSKYSTLKISALKPIETGVKEIPEDAKLLLKALQGNEDKTDLSLKDLTLFKFELPASPFVASGGARVDIEQIKSRIKTLKDSVDVLIVEGAGGLMVPINIDYFMIDLIQDVADLTLLITPSKLGSINETLLSIEALERRGINFDWCVNLKEEDREDFEQITAPFYRDYFGSFWELTRDIESFLERFVLINHQSY
jgi:dethiobiotin synthetase